MNIHADPDEVLPLGREGPAGPAVLASAATGIVPYIERLRGDVDSIFGNAGIAPEMAGSTTLKMSLSAFCRLFEQAARQTRRDSFGLWFGNQFQPRDLGLWGYAAVSAPTVASALEQLVGLFGFHQGSSAMRLARAGGRLRLEYQILAPGIVERRQDAELSLGMFLNVLREALGSGWSPEEVHFEHPRPEDPHEHERAFGAPVFFSQPVNALVFRPEVMGRPMPAADPRLMALMTSCLQGLAEAPAAGSTVDALRSAVRTRLPAGCPTLEAVSADLRLPAAAVSRCLTAEGIAFRDLVEQVRRDLALAYLRQRHLPLTEIAFLLGYSELSAFSRAVRRWTGAAPRRVRAGLLSS